MLFITGMRTGGDNYTVNFAATFVLPAVAENKYLDIFHNPVFRLGCAWEPWNIWKCSWRVSIRDLPTCPSTCTWHWTQVFLYYTQDLLPAHKLSCFVYVSVPQGFPGYPCPPHNPPWNWKPYSIMYSSICTIKSNCVKAQKKIYLKSWQNLTTQLLLNSRI